MWVLLIEDDAATARSIELILKAEGHDCDVRRLGEDGLAAAKLYAYDVILLDLMLPDMEGLEVLRRLRADNVGAPVLILSGLSDIDFKSKGLNIGADDYLIKPFDPQELRSRLQVGLRVLKLESALAGKVQELEQAMQHVKTLQGLLPICMYCKKIRDDSDSWHRVESYIEQHTEAMFTHSLCTDCREEYFPKKEETEPTSA
jgi:sigma-B regulation protein RsbU (phosphoserine phosphatase)